MGPAKKQPTKLESKGEVPTVFLTGNELGALKPCGCSGGQLGGLERRAAVLNSVPKKSRLIVDTGTLVESDGEQDLIKFGILIRALGMLGYDLINLTQKDIEITRNLGLLGNIGPELSVVSACRVSDANVPAKFTKRMLLNGEPITVTVVPSDMRAGWIESVEKLFPRTSGVQAVNILILNRCDRAGVDSIVKKLRFVDCLVCPADSDEPRIIGDANRRPLVLSAGRLGKYVGRLQIGAVKGKDGLKLSFRAVQVSEDLPPDSNLVELYKEYQEFVRVSGLLERQPRIFLPDGLEYRGSESCKTCHEYEYKKWRSKPHADAYATLERVGSAFDPECVVCHVVGMRYGSGFVSLERTAHLKDVGCENCHGPGSEHIATMGETLGPEPKSDCIDCHTPDNSANFQAEKQEYFEKIVHWKEQNTAGNVK
jgi:hypothetical protein